MDVGAFSPLYSPSPSTDGHPESSTQPLECRERRSYTLQYKLDVVKWLEERGSSLRQAAKHFGITRRVIRTWLEQKDQLKEAMELNHPNKRKLHGGRPPVSQELDKRVLEYLVSQRSEQASVGDPELRSKALEVGHQLGLEEFKANMSWLKRWKQRCGVHYQNGTNDVVSKRDKFVKSAFLSHIDSSERITLTVRHDVVTNSLDMTQMSQGPVYLDFSTSEHNYCQKAHQPNMFITTTLPGQLSTNEEQLYNPHGGHCHQLGSEQDISTLAHSSSDTVNTCTPHLLGEISVQSVSTTAGLTNAHHSSPAPPSAGTCSSPCVGEGGLDVLIPAGGVVQELVEGLELPLGHEEVVGESSAVAGRDGELIITQAAAISPPFHRDNTLLSDHTLSSSSSSQEHVSSYFTSTTSPSHQSQPLLSASFSRDPRLQDLVSLQSAQDYLIEMSSFLQESSSTITGSSLEPAPSSGAGAKQRGGSKKRYQPKRGCSKSKGGNAKNKKSRGQQQQQRRGRAVTPVATFPNLMLDDPQGYSGMLASRLSQPVFPGEPEFVYTDMATSH